MLAEETPNSLLEFEALRTAAKALLKLNRPRYALSDLSRRASSIPMIVKARQLEGMALGRDQALTPRRARARRARAEKHKDGETLGLFARTWKDEWTQVWNAHPQRKTDPPRRRARYRRNACKAPPAAYYEAFRADAGDYYPGINALTLGRLWEHVTGRKSKLPLDAIAAGVGWTVAVAVERNKDYWSLATRAELALVEDRKDDALDDYCRGRGAGGGRPRAFHARFDKPAARLPWHAGVPARDRWPRPR